MTDRCSLPRISVVTPCLNGERYVIDAIESVLRQGYPNFEHIIVDGGSIDGTPALLARYPHLTVIEDRGQGSHDAMNMGIMRAGGDLIGFLNVDDLYPPSIFHRAASVFAANPESDIVVGDSIVFEDTADGRNAVRFIFKHPRGIWLLECLFGNPAINGCFFRRSLFAKIGLFNNDFRITADRDFLIRVAAANVKAVALNTPAIWYRAHSQAQTINRQRPNILPITKELFCMASQYARRNKHASAGGNYGRAWQGLEGARLMSVELRDGQILGALKRFIGCSLESPLWPLHFVRAIILRQIARQCYRGGWSADLSGQIEEPWHPGPDNQG
jgi:glycosyltransferase involved in cell wall biosynthesis